MVFPWVFHQPNYIGNDFILHIGDFMKKIFSIGRLDGKDEDSNEDVVVGIDDGEVEGHFIFSVEAGSRNARFIANKDKVREILKALLDE